MPKQAQDGRGTTGHPLLLAHAGTRLPATLFSELSEALAYARGPLCMGEQEVRQGFSKRLAWTDGIEAAKMARVEQQPDRSPA